jgi:2-oxoglutarate ferredoxin oxidoreductase subunit delta
VLAEAAKKFRLREYKGAKGVFIISPDLCKGCGLCLERCPHQVIDWSEDLGIYGTPMAIPARMDDCIACGICQLVCPDAAILIEKNKKPAKKGAK